MHITKDNTQITQSCILVIPPGTVLEDSNGDGVLHLAADNITVRFAPGSILRGASPDQPGDALKGIGIRINQRRRVTLLDARVHGFRCGLLATQTDGLTLSGGDFSANYRQRLRSTPAAEDATDWLFPHHNDEWKWRDEYGAAIAVESATGVTVQEIRVRRGQNGILFDRVDDSRVYDNDCSFLSGWGLALWRSSRNVVSRNAFDFCVRGHVEGVYNRGQDSAGILCFEQCTDNQFLENSATHGGDGFFGFAGRDALGEAWLDAERERLRRETGQRDVDALVRVPEEVARRHESLGCNGNLFLENDFSYASAHGLELTFSRGNWIVANRLVESAICGIWGGYSSHTWIASNHFAGNGGMAYGLECGGVNMEHAANNLIVSNLFLNNRCAIHLWWDHDAGLSLSPGVHARNQGVSGNLIARNRIVVNTQHPFGSLRQDEILAALQIRGASGTQVTNNAWFDNTLELRSPHAREWLVEPGCEPNRTGSVPTLVLPPARPLGRQKPVGARAHLRGRHQIIMNEWGPWDHESPLIRRAQRDATAHDFDLFGLAQPPGIRILEGDVSTALTGEGQQRQLRVSSAPGVQPYRITLEAGAWREELTGTLLNTRWEATFFAWSIDPREDLEAWRGLAAQPGAQRVLLAHLDLNYAWRGPGSMKLSPALSARDPGPDHFGMIARTRVELPAGRWRVRTLSDDGVRVRVDGKTVLENWCWHGPTHDTAEFVQPRSSIIDLEVEHFEIDGFAVLGFELEPVLEP